MVRASAAPALSSSSRPKLPQWKISPPRCVSKSEATASAAVTHRVPTARCEETSHELRSASSS
eukprot:1447678-Prymnesium_polylepis.1